MSTRLPRMERERNVRSAVMPAIGSAAASARSTWPGTSATAVVSTAILCAHAPAPKAATLAPSAGPVPSAAARTTTPAAS